MKRFTSPLAPLVAGAVVDCHQHLWPEAFIEQLRRRSSPPRLDGWTLHLRGEPSGTLDARDHDFPARRRLDATDGIDLTLLSLSSPLGIETMRPDEATPLLEAWNSTADHLERDHVDGYGIWAAAQMTEPDLADLALNLKHPRVHGLQIPASAIKDPRALEGVADVLAVVEEADLPVFVHPGPAGLDGISPVVPSWWPALTSYTAQLTAAWFAWHIAGRALLPRLRVAFSSLAGLAPLHHERLVQRGGRLDRIDPLVHYETSSYGPTAVDAVTRVVGVDPLVHGSDRPYAVPTDPHLGDAFSQALFVTNPAHLLKGTPR